MTATELDRAMTDFSWYQRIALGDGRFTPGETGEHSEKKIELMQLPQDLSGSTVLDIGCNEGYFSFEAERRGASHVLAVDHDGKAAEKFRLLRDHFQSRVEFRQCGLDDLDANEVGRFDHVFFLAVFHHLRYPFRSLERLVEITAGTCYMEVPIVLIPNADQYPLLLPRPGKDRAILPNRAGLLEILDRAGFHDVEVLASHRSKRIKGELHAGLRQERILLTARRGEV